MDAWGSLDWRDIAKRSLKTFVQSFLAMMTVGVFQSMASEGSDDNAFKTVIIAALAAGYSVIWNAGMEWSRGRE